MGDSLGVCDGHLQHHVLWDLKELRVVSVGLQQEGQHVETALGGLPAQLGTDLKRNRAACFFLPKHTRESKPPFSKKKNKKKHKKQGACLVSSGPPQ